MVLENIISEELMAFIPVYVPLKGDCTKLYTKQGGIYHLEKNIKSVLNQLCKYYLIDLGATKKYYGDMLFIKNLVPIPLTGRDIFVYVKVRKPLNKNDGAFGFVNIKYVECVVEEDDGVFIKLKNQQKIKCLNSIEAVNKHIRDGNLVKKLHKKKYGITTIGEDVFSGEYDIPITREDVLSLLGKIMGIGGR